MARQTDKKSGGEEWQGSPFGNEDIEFSPFMFDAGEGDTANATANPGAGAASSGGQFSDSEMEFEPFMFDSGTGGLPNLQPKAPAAPNSNNFAPFNSSPFGDPLPAAASTSANAPARQPQQSPITGSDLPLPSYLAPTQSAASTAPAPSAPVVPAAQPANPSAFSRLSATPPSSLAMPSSSEPGMGMGMREQMTGRAPSGPLAELPDAAPTPAPAVPISPSYASAAPSVPSASASSYNPTPGMGMAGRARGNTGPLGPLPPDRMGASNNSWSDSSLASIEDFSSILIALRAGKRLRQSGPLHDSMIGQPPASVPSVTAVQDAPTQAATQQTTYSTPAPVSTPEHMGVATQSQNIPEWAVQATQSAPLSPEMVAPLAVETPLQNRFETRPHDIPQDLAEATYTWEPDLPTGTATAPVESAPQASVVSAEPAQQAAPVEEAPDPIQYHQMPADSVLNQVDSNVAEALKSMDTSVAPSNMSGEDIEFEGFMFNPGATTPMSSLPVPTAEELAAMSRDFGPAFDPTPYAVADTVEPEAEEPMTYDDVPASLFDYTPAVSQSAPVSSTPSVPSTPPTQTDATGGLPFWLQFEDAPTSSGPLADGDSLDTSAHMNSIDQNYYPTGDTDNGFTPQYVPSTMPSVNQGNTPRSDFNELPPIEPFDFSLVPTTDTDDTLGFNTEELSGLISGSHDPMTVTVNLAAVADLLGNSTNSGPLDTPPPSMPDQYDPNLDFGPEHETVAALDTMDPWTTGGQGAESWDNPTSASLTPTDALYNQPQAEEPISRPLWSQDVAPDLGLEADSTSPYSLSPEYTAPAATPAQPEPIASAPASDTGYSEPSDSTSAFSTDSSMNTGGWMAAGTSGLTMDSLGEANTGGFANNGSLGEQSSPVEELDVAPFDFTQLDQVDEEPSTGYLDAQQMKKTYGTASLEMPDDATGNLGAHPAVDNWSAEGDTSFFAQAQADEEAHGAAPEQPYRSSSFTAPLSMYPDQEDEAHATDYLEQADDTSSEAEQSVSAPDTYVAEEQHQAPSVPVVPDVSQETEPTEIKARVARGPWTSYTDNTDYSLPAPQAHTKAQQSASPSTPATPQPAHTPSSPHFEQSVRFPVDVDAMSTGPLPSLTGFEDLIGWVASNPQDIGAHMALASAYAQHEDVDSALRIYRRIIKKPTTSDTMLKMIWDDLSDLNDQAHHMPRYHQLSGDLLLRLGRHKEAVEAYNKLQSHEEE